MTVFTFLVPNPLIWFNQIDRRLNHNRLITPQELSVQALNDSTNLWNYIDTNYASTPAEFESWSIETQTRRIYYYIRSIIEYSYDIDNNGVFDYAATPNEVLTTKRDDCQGISCVLASLLIFLGYNAYIVECPFHWYVRVFYQNETDPQSIKFVDLYRHSRHTDPLVMFNANEVIIPNDLFWIVNTSFGDIYIAREFSEIMNGTNNTIDLSVISNSLPETNIPAYMGWLIIFLFCLILGFVVMIFLKIPNFTKRSGIEKISSALLFAIPMFIGFLGILFLLMSAFLYFGLGMVLIGTLSADITHFLFKPSRNTKKSE